VKKTYLPTPLTRNESTATDIEKARTATPPQPHQREVSRQTPSSEPPHQQLISSPPGDTQAFSQFHYPPRAFADEVEDEAAEGVWGYLIPLEDRLGQALVLRKRNRCPSADLEEKGGKKNGKLTPRPSKKLEPPTPIKAQPNGYLIGRHPECGK
jgi:serine/threonine-protein kinase CHEK2